MRVCIKERKEREEERERWRERDGEREVAKEGDREGEGEKEGEGEGLPTRNTNVQIEEIRQKNWSMKFVDIQCVSLCVCVGDCSKSKC